MESNSLIPVFSVDQLQDSYPDEFILEVDMIMTSMMMADHAKKIYDDVGILIDKLVTQGYRVEFVSRPEIIVYKFRKEK